MPTKFHLNAVDEKAIYDHHENSPLDSKYRHFLSRLFEPINLRLSANSSGLDFGSGPGPTLSIMFEEAGHEMQIYDPYYASDETVLTAKYDFVTASEVVEHLCQPITDLQRMWNCVRPGGTLGIMTRRTPAAVADFDNWHYTKDPTHVSFYGDTTFAWLADHWNAKLNLLENDVVLLHKPIAKASSQL